MSARFFAGFGALAAATTLLSACSVFSPRDLAIPQHVSVGDALEELACGFRRLRETQRGEKVGAIPAEMKVNLKVTVSSKDGGKLSVAPTVAGATISGEVSGESSASRENTIEITFKSLPLFLLEKSMTADGKKFDEKDIKSLIKLGQEQGVVLFAAEAPPSEKRMVAGAANGAMDPGEDVCAAYLHRDREETRRRERVR